MTLYWLQLGPRGSEPIERGRAEFFQPILEQCGRNRCIGVPGKRPRQGGIVHPVRKGAKIRAGKAGRLARDAIESDAFVARDIQDRIAEDLLPSFEAWRGHEHRVLKAPGPEKSRIEPP